MREPPDGPEIAWYSKHYGPRYIESISTPEAAGGTAYPVRGLLGNWMAARLRERRYRYLVAEFGTYPVVRVLEVMRAENRAHFYGAHELPSDTRAKAAMLECFCPKSPAWRSAVLRKGIGLVATAHRASAP